MKDYNSIYCSLPALLLPWYEESKRDLPWRKDKDPYHIWVSEIMLQQTRVEAVKGYYQRFLSALPTIADLANADEELLYKLWEGLGYYSRVRNLKKAAQRIAEDHGGIFPTQYDAVLSLPGIGVYTAGAICSIAFNQRVPAVDGNVMRVISRLTDDETPVDAESYKQDVRNKLMQIYPAEAGGFTQALMELGATLCGPNQKPNCEECPCREICLSYKNGTQELRPQKQPKKKRRVEEKTVFILSCDGYYALSKRPAKGLLASMWEFPNVDGIKDVTEALWRVEDFELQPGELLKQIDREHIFTHVQWLMRGYYIKVKERKGAFTWMTLEQIDSSAALPTAFRQFRKEI